MTIKDLARWRNAEPFQPFRLIFKDGSSVEVRRPNDIAQISLDLEVYVWEHPRWKTIDLSQIASIQSMN